MPRQTADAVTTPLDESSGNAHRGLTAADGGLAAALVALGLALHLPWIVRPFGTMEINGANFFGPFARTWEKFGFWDLRGTLLGPFELGDPATGIPYFNHPPGFAWLCAVFGTTEWQLRLPTVLGAILAGVLLFRLLLPTFGRGPAFLGGAALIVSPMLTFFCVTSYENAVLPVGLLAWLALIEIQRTTGARRSAWVATLALVSAAGAWLDWQYGFMVAALLPLAVVRSPSATIRRLALPWLTSAASLGVVVLWAWWATQSPRLPPGTDLVEIGRSVLHASALHPPALATFLGESAKRVIEGFTAPLLVVAMLGMIPLARRAPRLFAAGWVAGILNPVLLPPNSMSHVLYWAYFGPLVGAACAALAAAAATASRQLGLAVATGIIGAVVWTGFASLQHLEASATTFYRDYGEALTAATGLDPAAPGARRFAVAYNTQLRYGYYVRSEYVTVHPTDDINLLEQHRTAAGPWGIRYVLLQLEGSAMDQYEKQRAKPELVEYLSRFPRHELTQLEGQVVHVPGQDLEARVTHAWVVTLRE